jgi:hypothetical protein
MINARIKAVMKEELGICGNAKYPGERSVGGPANEYQNRVDTRRSSGWNGRNPRR